jgi:hypothetical protein
MLKIIKDCSPYYITFTHDNFDLVVEYIRNIFDAGATEKYETPVLCNIRQVIPTYKTQYNILEQENFEDIIQLFPDLKKLNLSPKSGIYMQTLPGVIHPIHKDGPTVNPHGYSLNYPVRIQDDCCVTRWYTDKNIARYANSNLFYSTGPLEILQTVTLKQDEAVLINGQIHHNWDNSASNNERITLTFRDSTPSQVSFELAKQKLFNL